MLNLAIIVASTRPGRKGPAIANWIYNKAISHSAFKVELLDLAVINLPFMDEPEHPRMKKYQHEHTKKWSATIDRADAFIVVTPEYNFGFTAALKNALDFLFHEWGTKPVGIVSYGGLSGGTRSAQMLKLVFTALKMMPLPESVAIPFFTKYIDAGGIFTADETLNSGADVLLTEVMTWATALHKIRQK